MSEASEVSGRVDRKTSPGRRPGPSGWCWAETLAYRVSGECTTEVYASRSPITLISSAGRSARPGSGARRRPAAVLSCGVRTKYAAKSTAPVAAASPTTTRCRSQGSPGARSASASACGNPSQASGTTQTLARVPSRMCRSPWARTVGSTGTATAPARQQARVRAAVSHQLGSW